MIQEVQKGDSIKAETINSIIAHCNKSEETNPIFGNGDSDNFIAATSGEFLDYPNMWSCKENDCEGGFTIRGGIVSVLVQYGGRKTSEECPYIISESTLSVTAPGTLYVNIDLTDSGDCVQMAYLSTSPYPEYLDTQKSIAVGEFFLNDHGILFYRQFNKGVIYISSVNLGSVIYPDKISFIGHDGITITDNTINGKRVVEIGNSVSPIPNDFSIIGEDGIVITDTMNNGIRNITVKLSTPILTDSITFDPTYFQIIDNQLTFNVHSLDDLISEAVNEIELEVTATGVQSVNAHGNLQYDTSTTNAQAVNLAVDSNIHY